MVDGQVKTTITPEHAFVSGVKRNQILDYPFKDFGYYKQVDIRKAYFEPVTHAQMFIRSLVAFLSQTDIVQSTRQTEYDGKSCWVYEVIKPNSAKNDSVLVKLFFQQLDSLPVGMEVYEHKHDILTKKQIEYLPYQPFRAEAIKKERIKIIKVKGIGKQRLTENFKGEEVKTNKKRGRSVYSGQWEKEEVSLTSNDLHLKGKYTLLTYWFSSCYYCIKSMPTLQRMHQDLASQDFQVVGVNPVDIDPIAIEAFLKKQNITYPNTTEIENILGAYEPASYPTYILLDKDGKVLEMQQGYDPKALERMVRKHVK